MTNSYSPDDTLADLLSVVGTDRVLMERIKITGADPVLPSKFLIGAVGAGVIGAMGLAASELWRLRTGRVQDVSLNVGAAAIGMRASLYFRKNGDSSTESLRANMQAGLHQRVVEPGVWILPRQGRCLDSTSLQFPPPCRRSAENSGRC